MSNAAMAMGGEAVVTPTALGWKFIHWGLGLFITGFVIGFIPILLHGRRTGRRCGPDLPEEHHAVVGLSGDSG